MTSYLTRLDAAPPEQRWAMARGWLFGEPLPFFTELRLNRPVLVLPEVTLAFRHADCMTVLRRHETFGVDLYKPKQGNYFMAQDDTPAHWREKSVMKAILNREDVPKIRKWVGEKTSEILREGAGKLDLVRGVTRGVPVAMVQHWFGFAGADPDKLIQWSYWNQQDAFWNQPFDAAFVADPEDIVNKRKAALVMMFFYLGRLVLKRSVAVKFGSDATDPVSRLLKLKFSDGIDFGMLDVVSNIGGLLIGAVETTSHAVVNAVEFLLSRPDLLAEARLAADDLAVFDGYVAEALRFRPAFPYFFRTCHRDTPLAAGTPHETLVRRGTTVLAITHSAMFDEAGFPDPDRFDPGRDQGDAFTFGQGMHDCLGRAIARAVVPEIARQLLLLPSLTPLASPDYRSGRVPEEWRVRYSL